MAKGATERSEAQRAKANANLKPFRKGQSGNPGGIPKDLREVILLARSHTAVAIEALVRVASDAAAPSAAQVSAAEAILNRAWGKPKDTVELQGADGAPLPLVVQFVRPE